MVYNLGLKKHFEWREIYPS